MSSNVLNSLPYSISTWAITILSCKRSKCAFGVFQVEDLGHILSLDRVHVDSMKIKEMKDWTCPKTLKILIVFLVLIGYYKKFVWNYGKTTTPLTTLLQNTFS